ncbi:MAG: hypothetical protein KDJ65_02330 [Anaerolineae bacterium]|nr:hypothetical protein [Anaerolineae bacterium]
MMNKHTVTIKTNFGQETVQPTGKVLYSLFEAFYRDNQIELLPKSYLSEEDLRRLPPEGEWKIEDEAGYFFIPEDRMTFCEDKRVPLLANRVWRRLPSFERRVLHELETRVTDLDQGSFLGRYLFSSADKHREQKKVGSLTESYPVHYAEEIPHVAYVAEAKTLEADSAATFVIARELAKLVLRQPQLYATAGALMDLEPDSYYAEHMIRQVQWGQDHATLQAWLWGFEEELDAYLAVKPNAFRRKWFKPLEEAR